MAEKCVDNLLGSLGQLGQKAEGKDLDLAFLKDLLESSDFQSLLKVHEKVTTPETQDFKPWNENTVDLALETCEEILHKRSTPDGEELLELLTDHHIKALLNCHDQIATKDFQPQLPDIPYEVDEDEQSVKVVRLVKGTSEPLGATIQRNDFTGAIKIVRVMRGGAADRSGLIHVGDLVLEVNAVQVTGKPPDEVVKILSEAVGCITLKLIPGERDNNNRESRLRVRAFFDYNPEDDTVIPCREAGLSFQRGDVLHIVSQDDHQWWQARREGDKNMRAGLIPGKMLQERKDPHRGNNQGIHDSSTVKDTKENKSHKLSSKFSPKLGKKQKKAKKISMSCQLQPPEEESDEFFTYEEVEQYTPKHGHYRPIILLGPPGVGRTELRRRVIASSPSIYKAPLPHTSRPKKSADGDGEDYHFITKHQMEKDIQNKRYVEYKDYKGHWYGTSMEEIKSIINGGKIAILCSQPQALKLLRTAEIKPCVIFIKPPATETLRETRKAPGAKSGKDDKSARSFTDEELLEMSERAVRLDTQYGHYFDYTVENNDIQTAVNEINQVTEKLQHDAHWVPASWVR